MLPALLILSVAACGGRKAKDEPPPSGETFGADDTYSRIYEVTPDVACEATRRALMGQGYVIDKTTIDTLEAHKSFQPESEVHTQLNVRATCVQQADGGAIVFVNALQDRYALVTTANSASVGVGMIGSVSLPIGSSGANLVRVASNTVQNTDFYRRFFDRVASYLPGTKGTVQPPPPAEPETPPDPVPPAQAVQPQPVPTQQTSPTSPNPSQPTAAQPASPQPLSSQPLSSQPVAQPVAQPVSQQPVPQQVSPQPPSQQPSADEGTAPASDEMLEFEVTEPVSPPAVP